MSLLYTGMKIFHYPDKIRSLPQSDPRILPPLHIRIKPTNRCNHHCRYCAYRVEGLQLGRDMRPKDQISREKMLEVVEDIINIGVKAVTFSGGGEPLCYPHFQEILRILAGSPVRFAALTNGTLLNGEVAELFARHGTWLRISMDGWDDESYGRYRGAGPNEYTRIMDNIKAFKNLGGACRLGVSLVIDRENAARVHECIGKLRDAGVDSVKIGPCIVSNDAQANNRYHDPVFLRVKEQIRQAIGAYANKDFEIFDSYHELDGKFNKDYHWCPYQQILPVIAADLNVYTCQDKAYNLAEGLIGSIESRRFKDLWFSDKSIFFKTNPGRHCRHHCVANAKNRLILEFLEADQEHLAFV